MSDRKTLDILNVALCREKMKCHPIPLSEPVTGRPEIEITSGLED